MGHNFTQEKKVQLSVLYIAEKRRQPFSLVLILKIQELIYGNIINHFTSIKKISPRNILIHTYTHIYTYTQINTHTYTNTHSLIHINTHTYTYTYMYIYVLYI